MMKFTSPKLWMLVLHCLNNATAQDLNELQKPALDPMANTPASPPRYGKATITCSTQGENGDSQTEIINSDVFVGTTPDWVKKVYAWVIDPVQTFITGHEPANNRFDEYAVRMIDTVLPGAKLPPYADSSIHFTMTVQPPNQNEDQNTPQQTQAIEPPQDMINGIPTNQALVLYSPPETCAKVTAPKTERLDITMDHKSAYISPTSMSQANKVNGDLVVSFQASTDGGSQCNIQIEFANSDETQKSQRGLGLIPTTKAESDILYSLVAIIWSSILMFFGTLKFAPKSYPARCAEKSLRRLCDRNKNNNRYRHIRITAQAHGKLQESSREMVVAM